MALFAANCAFCCMSRGMAFFGVAVALDAAVAFDVAVALDGCCP